MIREVSKFPKHRKNINNKKGLRRIQSFEEKLLDWLLHKDTHEDSKTNLDDLTIY